MTFTEFLLAICFLAGLYTLLKPLQNALELLFLKLLGRSAHPSKDWVYDAQITSKKEKE